MPNAERLRTLCAGLLALLVLFGIEIALLHRAAIDPRAPDWYRDAPLPIVDSARRFWAQPYRMHITCWLAGVTLASSAALWVIHRSLTERGKRRGDHLLIGIVCAIMLGSALLTPVVTSTDPYLYIGYGELGSHAYASHPLALPCPDPQPEAWCHQAVFTLPSVYGPLFLSYAHALFGHDAPTMQRLMLLRLANAGWFLLLLALLAALEIPAPTLAIVALNPLLIAQYVGDAHNDIISADIVTLGALAVRRHPWLTSLCCVLGSLVKLPFALFGAFAFTSLALVPRLAWVAITLGASAFAAWLWGGNPYLAAIHYHHDHIIGLASTEARMAFLVALFLVADRLFRRHVALSGAYAIPTLTITTAPYAWYALWSLPYLQADRTLLARFFIALPFTGFLVATPFQYTPIWGAILILALVYWIAVSIRTRMLAS